MGTDVGWFVDISDPHSTIWPQIQKRARYVSQRAFWSMDSRFNIKVL